MTSSSSQLRVFFLVFVLASSSLATVASVPESVAGEHETTDVDADAHLVSNGSYWGQTVLVFDNSTHPSDYELWFSGDSEDAPDFERTLTLSDDGGATFSTHGLDGQYEIRGSNGNNIAYATDQGELSTTSTTENREARFSATTQTLDANFESSYVHNENDSVELTIDTNRGPHAIEVSADGLNEGELEDIFGGSNDSMVEFSTSDADGEDDVLTLTNVSAGDYRTDFFGVDTGEYTFNFSAADTEASSNTTVMVNYFNPGRVRAQNYKSHDQTGDVVTVPVRMDYTDEGAMMIGSQEQNYWLIANLTDANDDDEITVKFNTHKTGSSFSGEQKIWATGTDKAEFVTEGGLHSETGNSRLAPREYDMYFFNRQDVLDRNVDEPLRDDANDVATLSLRDRAIDDVAVWTAPSNADVGEWDASDFSLGADTNVTQTDDITERDYAIFRIRASGVEGLLRNTTGGQALFTADTTTLAIEHPNGSRSEIGYIDGADPGVELIPDAANDTYYVVVSDDVGSELVTGTEYRASVTVGTEEAASSSFSIANPKTSLDTGDADHVLIQAGESEVISGETNRAPGTALTLTLRVDNATSTVLLKRSTTVQSNGEFAFPVNVARIGGETPVTLLVDSETYDGRIVPDSGGSVTSTASPTGTTVTQTIATAETETATRSKKVTVTEPSTTTSPADGNGPGFTVISALGTLIAAALLAIRRSN